MMGSNRKNRQPETRAWRFGNVNKHCHQQRFHEIAKNVVYRRTSFAIIFYFSRKYAVTNFATS